MNPDSRNVLYWIKRKDAVHAKAVVKCGLYKSLKMPVLLYDFTFVRGIKRGLALTTLLEHFQKKVVKSTNGVKKDASYVNQLRLLEFLHVPMFIQLSDIPTLTKIAALEGEATILPRHQSSGGRSSFFVLPKTRTEKTTGQFTFRM